MITLVSGHPRCGSSLMMAMLQAGGMDLYAETDISLETPRIMGLPDDWEWLHDCDGMAVKLLEPLRFTPPAHLDYAWIWLDRNPLQQARSQCKFIHTLDGHRFTGHDIDKLAAANRVDAHKAKDLIHTIGGPALFVTFETLITNSRFVAEKVSAFLPIDLDVDAMVSVVVERPARCLHYLLEMELYKQQAQRLRRPVRRIRQLSYQGPYDCRVWSHGHLAILREEPS